MNMSVPVSDVPLQPSDLDRAQIVSGSPEVSSAVLHSAGWSERGVWQVTPGVVTDVESELFVVVSGRATVEILDPQTGG